MAAEDFWSCAGVDFSVSQTLKSFISWLLPERYMQPEETECYFFTPRKRKYKNGIRPIRSAGDGYWKATGADLEIKYRKKLVGWRKSLVFYLGTPPQGKKTNWIMHEFKLNKPPITKTDPDDMSLDKWVLCKVYENSRRSRHPTCERYVDDDDDQDINPDPSTIPTFSGNILDVANDGEQEVKHDIHIIPTNMRNIHNAAALNGDQDTKHALSTGCLHNPNYTYPTIQPIYEIPPHHNPTMISSQPPLPVKSSQPHSISDAMPWQPPLMSDAMPWQANLMSDAMPSQPHSTLDAMPSESHLTDSQPLSLTVVPPPSVNVQPQPFDGLLPDISTPKFDLDDDNLDLFQNDPFWNDIFRDSDSPPPK